MTKRNDQRGTLTLWILGLSMLIMMMGGISLDLWRAFTARRAMASLADAAAVAGASGINEDEFRAGRGVKLDPARVEELARDNIAAQLSPQCDGGYQGQDGQRNDACPLTGDPVIEILDPGGPNERVRVIVRGRIDLTLLKLLGPTLNDTALDVEVTSFARPFASD